MNVIIRIVISQVIFYLQMSLAGFKPLITGLRVECSTTVPPGRLPRWPYSQHFVFLVSYPPSQKARVFAPAGLYSLV